MTYKELTETQKEYLLEMINKGMSGKEIGDYFNVDRSTANRWRKKIKKEFKVNLPDDGYFVKSKSTLYDDKGEVKLEWIKQDQKKLDELNAVREAISEIVKDVEPIGKIKAPKINNDDICNVYISNDLHIGMLTWHEETLDRDWDLSIAESTIKSSYDYLMSNSPNTKVGVVLDLGDLVEADNPSNVTPKSGHTLDVDGRYPKILRTAYSTLIYGIENALKKHELVYFINVAGNHDVVTSHTVREVIRAYFVNNPRVIVDEAPSNIKYFQFGKTLLQFAHGDGMKMQQAGEVMAFDKRDILHECDYRYSLFGHNHKDSVVETRLTRAESFRNLAPLNFWASSSGFRGGIGTMNCITYSKEFGEIGRQKFNVNMLED